MFVLHGLQGKIKIESQSEIDSVINKLVTEGYNPALRSMIEGFRITATLPMESIRLDAMTEFDSRRLGRAYYFVPPVGDLLFKDERAFVLQPSHKGLQFWEIRQHTTASDLNTFMHQALEAIRQIRIRSMPEIETLSWEKIKGRSPLVFGLGTRPPKPELNTIEPLYTENDLIAAKMLVSVENREVLTRLAKLTKPRVVDAMDVSEQDLLEAFITKGSARKEFVVQCRQDSRLLCVIQDPSELENGTIICAVCGRRYKDELIKEIFAITDKGKALLNRSHWMTIWITDILIQSGASKDSIGWNATSGEDEIDIVLAEFGSQIFFELKDREFGLGDAYPFVSRVARYGGDIGIVISTERIADEVKKFVDEQLPNMNSEIWLMENVNSIEQSISSLFDRLSRKHIYNLVSELGDFLRIRLMPLVGVWMDKIRLETERPQSNSVNELAR